MNELKRVLKPTGTCWVNLGDSYTGGNRGGKSNTSQLNNKMLEIQSAVGTMPKQDIQSKSRMGIPERFYINCIDNGWIARNNIIWFKANALPSSVKDRFTNKYESVFFFSKQQKYYFDLDAVREKPQTESKPFNVRVRDSKRGLIQAKLTGGMSDTEDENYNHKGEIKEKYACDKRMNVTRLHRDREGNPNKAQDQYNSRMMQAREQTRQHDNPLGNPKGKNPGDVFFINPRPFPEAHHAVFPVDLPLKILKCACPKDGIVLDPFFGAGTTAVAAEQLGRNWIGIELNPEYIKIAAKRLEKYQNQRLIKKVITPPTISSI